MGYADRLKRAFAAAGEDNIALLAAGVSYYAFLAMVPLLAAVVLVYGLFADPAMVADHLRTLAERLPQSAAQLIGGQLQAMVETSGTAKGFGLLLALAVALFGARNGAGALVTAISLAFNDDEQRGLLRATALALAITLGAIVVLGLVVGVLALATSLTGESGAGRTIAQALAYGLLATIGTLGAAWMYRRVPNCSSPRFRQVLPGAVFASVAVALLTAGFGFYVANFGSYNATYGSLGAVIVLLTWLYLSAYALLFGAEVAAVCVQDEAC